MICTRACIWRTDKNHTVRIDNVQVYARRQKAKKSRNVASAYIAWSMASSLVALFTKAGQQARLMLFAADSELRSENSKLGCDLGGKRSTQQVSVCCQVWHPEIFQRFFSAPGFSMFQLPLRGSKLWELSRCSLLDSASGQTPE